MLFDVLKSYGLSNVADASKTIPVIIQSFDANGLIKMATLTDLPMVLLCNDAHTYDYNYVSTYANAVGVPLDWIEKSERDNGEGDSDYSSFIKQMHNLDLAVHPYTDKDDDLKFGDTVYDQAENFVNKGVDGLFVEFPHTQYTLLQHLGSKANFPQSPAVKPETTFLN